MEHEVIPVRIMEPGGAAGSPYNPMSTHDKGTAPSRQRRLSRELIARQRLESLGYRGYLGKTPFTPAGGFSACFPPFGRTASVFATGG